jgi:hypothetical protein
MVAAEDQGGSLLREMLGARLESAARTFYELRGCIDDRVGPLELAFAGGRTLHLTTATNGESVWIRPGPWIDPFADRYGETDAGWSREHGRYVRVDVSEEPGYAEAVGARLDALRWLANAHGSIAGVEMRFGAAPLTFVSWGDDEYVFTGDAESVPAAWAMRIVPPNG